MERTTDSFLYSYWRHVRDRCYNKRSKDYARYGGRGITMHHEWRDNFRAFEGWCLSNGYSKKLSLDRIDNFGNYTPDNCRFATAKQQARNRRNNTLITAFGETKIMQEWVEDPRCTVNKYALSKRLTVQKLPPEIAITHPVQPRIKGGRRNKIQVIHIP